MKRFEDKIKRNVKNGCWEWTASLNPDGYGRFYLNEKYMGAHRASWMIHNGEIPSGDGSHGTCVLHKCDNRKCVNPDHLFLGSQQDNLSDMEEKGRRDSSKGKSHYRYDHAVYTFKHKIKGWKLRCGRNYLRELFNLDQGQLSLVINGKLPSVKGWVLA